MNQYTGQIPVVVSQTFEINGALAIERTVDMPSRKTVNVLLRVDGKKTVPVSLRDADYDALCEQWATDTDLLAFIVAKFGLTPVTPANPET